MKGISVGAPNLKAAYRLSPEPVWARALVAELELFASHQEDMNARPEKYSEELVKEVECAIESDLTLHIRRIIWKLKEAESFVELDSGLKPGRALYPSEMVDLS